MSSEVSGDLFEQALVKQSILGMQRQNPEWPWSDPALQERAQHWTALAPEQQLLNAMALYHSYRAVGRDGKRDGGRHTVVRQTPAPAETQSYAKAEVQQLLGRFIVDNHVLLVAEALHGIAENQQLVAPQYLPQLFDMATKSNVLRGDLLATMGQRGAWLAQHNREWSNALGINVEPAAESSAHGSGQSVSEWILAAGENRLNLLRQALQNRPQQTWAELKNHWSEESAKDRLQLFEALENFLTAEQLPLLQEWKNDRSQNIKEKSVQYLLSFGDQELTEKLRQRLQQAFAVKKGLLGKLSLEVVLPDKFDDSWKALGIQEKLNYLPTGEKIGNKAGQLFQCLRLLSPSMLAQQFNVDLDAWLHACQKNEFASALLSGMDESGGFYRDEKYVLLRSRTVGDKERLSWLNNVVNRFDEALVENILVDHIDKVAKGQSLYQVLNMTAQISRFSPKFTNKVLAVLLREVREDTRLYNEFAKQLENLAFKLPLQEYANISARLDKTNLPQFTELLKNYSLRYQLQQQLQQELRHE